MVQNFSEFQTHCREGSHTNDWVSGRRCPRQEGACCFCARVDWLENRHRILLFREVRSSRARAARSNGIAFTFRSLVCFDLRPWHKCCVRVVETQVPEKAEAADDEEALDEDAGDAINEGDDGQEDHVAEASRCSAARLTFVKGEGDADGAVLILNPAAVTALLSPTRRRRASYACHVCVRPSLN